MVSIIIPSYNSATTIRSCLESLVTQTYSGDYEIILVDSSDDETPEIVKKHFPQITMIHLSRKTDPGTGRNLGVKHSRGNIIAFIDSDCRATPNWLKSIVRAHQTEICAVGGPVFNGNSSRDFIGLAGYIAEFREYIPGQKKGIKPHLPTCNISYKKDIFLENNGFDGTFYPQEDLVFNHLLSEQGLKILYDPEVSVYHMHRSTFRNFTRHQFVIGNINASVLIRYKMDGSFFARHPFAALFSLPLIYTIKFIRTLTVFLKYQPGLIFYHLPVVPIFAYGLFFWAFGFTAGSFKKGNYRYLTDTKNE
jgi:glycosyltransferase involved in cell wall biosynthesis